jgi:hypothetical protein
VLFLTRWEGYEDPKHDTWEPLDHFARNNYVVYRYVAKQPSLKKCLSYFVCHTLLADPKYDRLWS